MCWFMQLTMPFWSGVGVYRHERLSLSVADRAQEVMIESHQSQAYL